MPDDVSDIRAFYDDDPHKEDSRLEEHQLEYEMTWRYLEQYLPAQGSILEVGAASGRYTLELARRGYMVTAVDLSAALLEINRKRLADAGLTNQVRFVVADARDLSAVSEDTFDAALLMGPLYHLLLEDDRKTALKQVYDRLRPDGIIFSALLSRFGIMGDLIKKTPAWIENPAAVQWLLSHGHRPDDAPPGGFRGYFARIDEIAPLHESVGFETLTLAGVEPGISADDESYNILQGEQRRLWLDLLYAISTEPTTIGASRHLLYIGRKK
jgi:SAM-dependent methyltransferase